jgi:hypothetical protein
MIDWTDVEIVLPHAKAIAFDGCHKIYVLMDNEQVAKMTTYGYGDDDGSYLLTADKMSKAEMLDTLERWYDDSCSLRFIHGVSTVAEGTDPNEGYSDLIAQGADWVDDEEDYDDPDHYGDEDEDDEDY